MIRAKDIQFVNPNDLKPNDKNRNIHPPEQIDRLAKLIEYQGFRAPIVVSNRSGKIAAGDGRRLAAIKLGLTEVPVTYQDFENEEQEVAFGVSDNAIASWAELDMSNIMTDMKGFDKTFDFDLFGIRNLDMNGMEPEPPGDPDEVPDVPIEPQSKPGDLYELGNHRVLCGDSTDPNCVDKLIGPSKIDMVHTDPPYGINEKGDRSHRGGLTQGNNLKDFVDDSIQYAIDAFNICAALEIPIQVWWGANYYCHSIPQTNNWLVWDKRVEDKQRDFNSDAELAWVKNGKNSTRLFRHLWKGLIKASEHGQARVHPTQKPVALPEWCFEEYGEKCKTILDLFGGSGSTLIACEKTKREARLMELDPHYVDVIVTRYCKYTGKNTIKRNGEEIVWDAI